MQDGRRWGVRFENSGAGQALLSFVMLVVIVSVFAWNSPNGPLHNRANRVAGPIVEAIGMEQDWALFAPTPRQFSVGVYAEITMRDGRVERWVPPHNGVLITPYRTYRWQKYVERLRGDDYAGLWQPTAAWLARERGGAAKVARVVLVRTFRDVVVPGSGKKRGPTRQFAFYTYDVPR